MKWVLLLVTLSTAAVAQQKETPGEGHWKGSGATFDAYGKQVATFDVDLTRTVSGDLVETQGNATYPGGKIYPFTQKMKMYGTAFSLEGSNGKGGGSCLGDGLCLAYQDAGDGHAFAVTLVFDGADKMRVVVTELQNGKAIRFVRQSLKKLP